MPDYSDMARVLAPALAAYFHDYAGSRDLGRGTALPLTADVRGGLLAGDRFFRTDLGWACYYDGTRWLTQHEVAHPLKINDTTAPVTYALAGNSVTVQSPYRSDFSLYIMRVSSITSVAATNNATNFWTYTLRALLADGTSATTIHTFTTAADAAGVGSSHDSAPSTTAIISSRSYVDIVVTKTLSPGALTFWSTVYYRLIIT
ncbi:MAG: hypothetical protein M3R61_00225 [Chloroflexota bacterium]|nr:hypothetical protein [Chloroflexota bacterium]